MSKVYLALAGLLFLTPQRASGIEPIAKFSRSSVPSDWAYFLGQTPSQVATGFLGSSRRIVDVHVDQASPLLLTGAAVSNTGTFATSWWWYYDISGNDVGNLLTSNQARLTNLKGYFSGGQQRYFAVMVDNTNDAARAWSWFPDADLSSLKTTLATTGDRVIDMSTWLDGSNSRHYSVVTIANTGTDYVSMPSNATQWVELPSTGSICSPSADCSCGSCGIREWLSVNPGTRVIDLENESNGRFLAVIAYDAAKPNTNTGTSAIAPNSWFLHDVGTTTFPAERNFNHILQTTGSRIISVAPNQPAVAGSTFDVATVSSRPVQVSSLSTPNNDGSGQFNYLDTNIKNFLRQYGITGASVAIAKGDKLVYARSYGYSDTEFSGGQLATPNTLYRVGSISKFVTAVSVMRLIQDGARTPAGTPLTLDTHVFTEVIRPFFGLPLSAEGSAATSPGGGLEAITIRQLLNHTSGYDDGSFASGTACPGNPLVKTSCIAPLIGTASTPTCQDLIRLWAINKPIQNAPGTQAAYSNFGFCILQTVVDSVYSSGYQSYVTDKFINTIPLNDANHSNAPQLAPSSDTYSAASGAAHDYFGLNSDLSVSNLWPQNPYWVEGPYGGVPMLPGLGTGGWKASAVGLLKLALSVNQSATTGQVLNASSFNAMWSPSNQSSTPSGNFGLGLEMNCGNGDMFKTGSVAGGSGLVVFRNFFSSGCTVAGSAGGITWVALVNTEGTTEPGMPDPFAGINNAMIDSLYNANVYSGVVNATADLFPSYGLPAGP